MTAAVQAGALSRPVTDWHTINWHSAQRIVRRLQARGLVERLSVPHDRRAVRVKLTERGRLRAGAALTGHARILEKVLGDAPPSELGELRDRLGALTRILEAPSR